MNQKNKGALIATVVLLAVNAVLWYVPSNVAYLMAQNRDVLLGRYSVDRFTVHLILLLLTLAALYVLWARGSVRRERLFKVITIGCGLLVGLVVVDVAARLWRSPRYVQTQEVYHRPPNNRITGVFKDAPAKPYLYVRPAPGFPQVAYTLTVDKRGFRNLSDLPQYQFVVLGDSFAEGSKVSDEQTWAARFGRRHGSSVYNLGMSGGSPSTYVETLKLFGLDLSPGVVLCMLYEGNDFRGSGKIKSRTERRAAWRERWRDLRKNSPVRLAGKKLLIKWFALDRTPASAAARAAPSTKAAASTKHASAARSPGRANDALAALAWLPVAIPPGPGAKYYDFDLKRLLAHYQDPDAFKNSPGCQTVFDALKTLQTLCRRHHARLILLYAPDKPHVVMPLVRQQIASEQLRRYLALKKKNLPPPAETFERLYANLGAREQIIRDFCQAEGIEFVSLTSRLRREVYKGRQVYFTYDQHWTPEGHAVVAEVLQAYLQQHPNS